MIETKLVTRLTEKLDEVDKRAAETMASGSLQNFGEYRFSAGYRKALQDAKTLLNETFEDIMKE